MEVLLLGRHKILLWYCTRLLQVLVRRMPGFCCNSWQVNPWHVFLFFIEVIGWNHCVSRTGYYFYGKTKRKVKNAIEVISCTRHHLLYIIVYWGPAPPRPNDPADTPTLTVSFHFFDPQIFIPRSNDPSIRWEEYNPVRFSRNLSAYYSLDELKD